MAGFRYLNQVFKVKISNFNASASGFYSTANWESFNQGNLCISLFVLNGYEHPAMDQYDQYVYALFNKGFSKFIPEDELRKELIWDESTGKDQKVDVFDDTPETKKTEYIYDTPDIGAEVKLPLEILDNVQDIDSAVKAVEEMVNGMTEPQKSAPTGVDIATLYAETAVMRAATSEAAGKEILINAAVAADLSETAVRASKAVEEALLNGGVTTNRYLFSTIVLTTDETDIRIQIDPDVLNTQADKVRVETPAYALTFKLKDLEADLSQSLMFTAEGTGVGYAPSKIAKGTKTVIKVGLPKGRTSNPITVSLPKESDSTMYQTVVSTNGTATASKHNPVSDLMDSKISISGSYTVKTVERDFSDIANKSQEMKQAIRYLASRGIINGTTETQFSPDGSINRAEIATLIVKALGKLDPTVTADFTDVERSSWYYSAAASSQRQGFIQGYEDRTFRGTVPISKIQIAAVASRVLIKEMGYKKPDHPEVYLSKYSDAVAPWAQADIALATRENVLLYRQDGTFSGSKNMTRGDAAIIIYRMFRKIW